MQLDDQWVSVAQINAVALSEQTLQLSDSRAYQQQIDAGAQFVMSLLQKEGSVYGVTTGYGDSCSTGVSAELVAQLPQQLFTFHGCGTGEMLSDTQVRAVLAARMVSLGKGYSGVRFELLQALERLLQHDILPLIPAEGSVGASGDLTPLSYVAAVLSGLRQVRYQGQQRNTAEVFAELGINALKLQPKETLALMNGTAVMTGLACIAHHRASYLARLGARITALVSLGVAGNPEHFDAELFAVKPHAGQQQIAAWVEADLAAAPRNTMRLQDRYSIRCAPHILGVLQDALPWLTQWLEQELNSANDNPIVDVANEKIHHGGHFYGGHIAFAMDSLKTAVANIADLFDRQMALLVDTKFNPDLPANLSGASAERLPINHGFKAVQIAVSAWTAEALKLTMPASVFSRSTECHNQDKVSMGTISARDCLRVLQLTEQAAAATLMASVQAVELRLNKGLLASSQLNLALEQSLSEVRKLSPFLAEDRELDKEVIAMVSAIQQQNFSVAE